MRVFLSALVSVFLCTCFSGRSALKSLHLKMFDMTLQIRCISVKKAAVGTESRHTFGRGVACLAKQHLGHAVWRGVLLFLRTFTCCSKAFREGAIDAILGSRQIRQHDREST